MASRQNLLEQARSEFSRGNAVEASRHCAKLLSADPRDVDALYLRGRCHATLGKWADAATEFRRVLKIRPDSWQATVDLGLALALAEDYRDASALLQRALAQSPRSAQLHFGLGLCKVHEGDLASAAQAFLAAIAHDPRFADAYNHLGVVQDRLGQLPQAVESFRQAAALRPGFATALGNLGHALLRLGNAAPAGDAFREATVVRPQDALLHADLGAARLAAREFSAAVTALERALSLDPKLAHAASNLGEAWLNLNASDRAVAAFRHALGIDPDMAQAHLGLGRVAAALGDAAEARSRLLRAVDLKPRDPEIALAAASALESLGQHAQAIAALERALTVRPSHSETLAALASCAFRTCAWDLIDQAITDLRGAHHGLDALHPFLLLAADVAPAEQSHSLQRRGRLYSIPVRARDTAPLARGPRRAPAPLRVAYVSPDFREHPVAHAIAGVIDKHDRQTVTPIAISLSTPDVSDIGKRLRSSFDEVIDASSMSDLDVARQLKQREVDIAIDLAGHTLGSRPGIFAQRAAPVQVNFLGFPASTGFQFMDYIIADEIVVPSSDEPFYTERVLRMPDCYLPFDSSRPTALQHISREQFGLPLEGFVFCAFNSAYKITRDVFHQWLRILHDVPKSVLWLRSMGATVSANLRNAAAAFDIAPDRLIFAPFLPSVDANLARLRLADLFLDTSPYNAHTSAAEALWAGVPVLSRLGDRFAGRVGASLLTSAGLPELICADNDHYLTLAVDLAHSPSLLENFRERLIASRETSPVFDTVRYTQGLEALLLDAAKRPL